MRRGRSPKICRQIEMIECPVKVSIGQVYLNNLHSLSRICIKNTSEHLLYIKLRSNVFHTNQMNNQICFQKTNENITENSFIMNSTQDVASVDYLATNTVKAAHSNEQNIQFNQLFNHVNYIKSIQIRPGQSEFVILAFLPDRSLQLEPNHQDAPDNFDFKEDNGLIFLLCYKSDDSFDKNVPDAVPDYQVLLVNLRQPSNLGPRYANPC